MNLNLFVNFFVPERCENKLVIILFELPSQFDITSAYSETGECNRTSYVISEHCLSWCFCAVKQQTIAWANAGPDLCRYMASLCHIEIIDIHLCREFPYWVTRIRRLPKTIRRECVSMNILKMTSEKRLSVEYQPFSYQIRVLIRMYPV